MNKIRAAAFFCTVIFAIGALTAQATTGQMTPQTQSPQMSQPGQRMPTTPPQDQSAPPNQTPQQPSQGRMSNIDDQVKVLSDSLNLNTGQQSKVRSILMDQHDQAMALIQDNSMAREEKIEKIHSLRASTITKVRQLLNDDQKTKFDQMVSQQDERLKQQQGQSGSTGTAPSSSSPNTTSPSTPPPASNPPASTPPASNPPSGNKPPQLVPEKVFRPLAGMPSWSFR